MKLPIVEIQKLFLQVSSKFMLVGGPQKMAILVNGNKILLRIRCQLLIKFFHYLIFLSIFQILLLTILRQLPVFIKGLICIASKIIAKLHQLITQNLSQQPYLFRKLKHLEVLEDLLLTGKGA